jgi:hypothetical protein
MGSVGTLTSVLLDAFSGPVFTFVTNGRGTVMTLNAWVRPTWAAALQRHRTTRTGTGYLLPVLSLTLPKMTGVRRAFSYATSIVGSPARAAKRAVTAFLSPILGKRAEAPVVARSAYVRPIHGAPSDAVLRIVKIGTAFAKTMSGQTSLIGTLTRRAYVTAVYGAKARAARMRPKAWMPTLVTSATVRLTKVREVLATVAPIMGQFFFTGRVTRIATSVVRKIAATSEPIYRILLQAFVTYLERRWDVTVSERAVPLTQTDRYVEMHATDLEAPPAPVTPPPPAPTPARPLVADTWHAEPTWQVTAAEQTADTEYRDVPVILSREAA